MKNEKVKFFEEFGRILENHKLGQVKLVNENFPKAREQVLKLWKYKFKNRYSCLELHEESKEVLKKLYPHTSNLFSLFSTPYDNLHK